MACIKWIRLGVVLMGLLGGACSCSDPEPLKVYEPAWLGSGPPRKNHCDPSEPRFTEIPGSKFDGVIVPGAYMATDVTKKQVYWEPSSDDVIKAERGIRLYLS